MIASPEDGTDSDKHFFTIWVKTSKKSGCFVEISRIRNLVAEWKADSVENSGLLGRDATEF